MKPTYFISDVHLSPDLPRVTAGLLELLRQLHGSAEALYVLGDLFEAWVGDDNSNDYNQQIIDAFASLSAHGTALYFVHGNRDFLLGSQFVHSCRGYLLPERQVIDCYGTSVLVEHGDALCTHDTRYMAFRQQSRSAEWQAGMLAKPLAERLQIAELWRAQSRMMNSNKPENIMDVADEAVDSELRTHAARVLLHGHTHRPAIHEFAVDGQAVRRVVLGDWQEEAGRAMIGVADENGIRLQEWSF